MHVDIAQRRDRDKYEPHSSQGKGREMNFRPAQAGSRGKINFNTLLKTMY